VNFGPVLRRPIETAALIRQVQIPVELKFTCSIMEALD
jgi:hypothetical protein